jgi:hypothetical protein
MFLARTYKKVAHIFLSAQQHRFMRGILIVTTLFAAILSATILNALNTVEAASTSTPTGAALTAGPLKFPTGFMQSVKDYGAVGDGVTDDTAAIQSALSDGRNDVSGDYYGVPKALYFPPGKYLVSNTLSWNGCCVTLQGAGSSSSVIRLAPGSAGFGGTTAKAVISTPDGNTSFRQNIWDLGFSIGANNPGAVGLDYISNNTGSIHNVSLVSEDGQGIAGIALTRHYPGPLMMKNVYIHGFQMGINTSAYEYGLTLEGITLVRQTIAGIHNQQQTISIRNLTSINTVPAVINDGGFAVIVDAALTGGKRSLQGIQNNGGLYLRNVSSNDYGATLLDSSSSVPVTKTGTITEYVEGTPQSLASPGSSSSLNLSVEETPSFVDQSLSKWAAFIPAYYGDTKGLQALLNSGASTIYFPFAAYFSYNETAVTVPDTVRRIVGFSSIVNGSTAGTSGGGIRFIVNSASTSPLVVEQFGYGIKVDHHGTRPIAIKDGRYTYTSYAGAGNLFLEDVELPQVTFQSGQSVWARQLDDEFSGTKIINHGTLWLLGLKTEQPGTVINTTRGGQTELLGNLIYPVQTLPANSVAFQDTDANVSYIYSESVYCSSCGYAVQVSETRDGTNRQLVSNQGLRYLMHLFVGY